MNQAVVDLDAVFGALADPVRRHVVELLAEAPRRSGELAATLGVTPAMMSKHLRVLRASGVVTASTGEFDTRVRIYALSSAPMTELRRWLQAAEAGWSAQLTAFAEHLAVDAAGAR